MTTQNNENLSLGDLLLASGWHQGSLFRAPSACFGWNELSDADPGTPLVLQPRKTKSRETFVLITQDCDIKANLNLEPHVEALVCVIDKREQFLAQIDRNSARWFVVDPQTGLVAQAKYRVQFSKQALATLIPEPWPSSQERLDRFIRWLGRRYDRPAVPDRIVEVFQRPVEQALAQLVEQRPDMVLAFSRAVHELRVNLPMREEEPFDLQLVLLIRGDELTDEEANAIDAILEAIRTSLNPELVDLAQERILTADEISLTEYYASRPLFLEYLSYRGEEVEGAPPFRSV